MVIITHNVQIINWWEDVCGCEKMLYRGLCENACDRLWIMLKCENQWALTAIHLI